MNSTAKAWPEKFVYVCSAGKAQVANAGPMRNAGLECIARVIILCGAVDPKSDDSNTRREAVDPKDRLIAWIEQKSDYRLSVAAGTIYVIYGDPFDLQHWRAALRDHLTASVDEQIHIVLNVKGGTKEMAIGGIMAIARRDHRTMVTVRVAPDRVECIDAAPPSILPAPAGYLTFTEYLSLYGFTLGGETKEVLYREEREWIERFCAGVRGNVSGVPLILNRMIKQFCPNSDKYRFEPAVIPAGWGNVYGNDWTHVQQAFEAMDGHFGFSISRGEVGAPAQYRIGDIAAAAFLSGGWLEAQLFLALETALAGRNDVELRANPLLFDRSGKTLITEIDVAVMIRGQLHILEAKTAAMDSAVKTENAERSLAQIATNKSDLLGQMGGHAFVVNSTITKVGPSVFQRARSTGVGLILGPAAVAKAVQQICNLANGQ